MQKIGSSTTSADASGEFTEGNAAGGQPATLLKASWLNSVQRELIAAIALAGLDPDPAKDSQLASAITSITRTGASNYALDKGTANTYKATFKPAVDSLVDGMVLRFIAKNGSTGASTFAPDGVPARPLINTRYKPMEAGQIAGGSVCWVEYVASLDAWVLLFATGNAVPTTIAGYGITDAYNKGEIDTKLGAQTKVVNTPTVTGSASVTAGTSVTLSASSSSLLTGGSIASFTWTLPDGTTTTTAAASNAASKVVIATGSIGTSYVVKVYATDAAGNTSGVATKSIAITNHVAPTVPTTATVGGNVYQNSTGNTLTASGSTASDGASITYALSQSGPVSLTFSKNSGIAANEVVTFSAPSVAADTQVTLTVVANDSLGGQSAAKTISVTIYAVPTTAGAPFGGGIYTGRMVRSGVTYALVTAPKASGEPPSTLTFDQATAWAAALTIGGFNDWRLPTQTMADMQYRAFKPDGTANKTTGNSPYSEPLGVNSESVPSGSQYTASVPAITTLSAYLTGGAEAFGSGKYWTSERDGHYAAQQEYIKNFGNGDNTSVYYGNTGPARAVRLVPIQ